MNIETKEFCQWASCIMLGPRLNSIFLAHKQNSIVSIFRGDFLSRGIGVALNLAHNTQPVTCFLTHQSLFLHPCSCWDISLWILKQKNFVNELLTILSGPRPKPIFPAH